MMFMLLNCLTGVRRRQGHARPAALPDLLQQALVAVWSDRTVVKALERPFASFGTGDRLARSREDRIGQVFELIRRTS